jgi:hypothetical protein
VEPDREAFLKASREALELVDVPWRDIASHEGWREASEEAAEFLWAWVFRPPLELAKDMDTALAQARLLRVGLELEIYAREQGNYPESLAELREWSQQEIPKDPLSGADFIYRRTEGGFEVYSVGWNLQDDGGVRWEEGRRDGAWDMVFEVE